MTDENIRGGRELAQFLATLAPKVEKNIMRSALRAGANAFKPEVKANIPVDQGDLKKSVRITTKTKRGIIVVSLKAGGKKAPHANLVEFGTRPHKITPKNAEALAIRGHIVADVDHPGAKPHPYMRPAFDSKPSQAIAAVAAQVRKRLTAEGINVPAPEAG